MGAAQQMLSSYGAPAPIVFSAVARTGTGASAVQTVNIDLSTNAGLVWTKGRSGATSHKITDTKRGVTKAWSSDTTAADATDTNGITAFSTTGYTVGSDSNYNTNAATYLDWVIRESANFLSIVQFSGNNVSTGRTIAHTLTTAPGMVVVVANNGTLGHYVWHRSVTSGNFLLLNSTAAPSSTAANTFFGNGTITVDPDSSNVTVGLGLNVTGTNYTMYCFGHVANGAIQCGGYTGNGSTQTVNCGLANGIRAALIKRLDNTGDWFMFDTTRGIAVGNDPQLSANTAAAEGTGTDSIDPASSGFLIRNGNTLNNLTSTYAYLIFT